MEEKEEPASTEPKPKQLALCEECKMNPSKYKCPGCSLRSCSLLCVRAHKQRTRCTGQRNRTQFVPLSQFDDNLLLSDYNLLEEVKRVAESAHRMRTKLCPYSHFRLPNYLRSLRGAAASRRVKLLFLPPGMSKREKNKSRYDQRKKFVSWTIEWRFHSTDVVLLDHGVHEDTNLCSVIERHLKPGPWSHQLRRFCQEQRDCLKFFVRKYPKGPRSPFMELDIKASLRQQLANIVILEYPVIHVSLPSDSCNFEVVNRMYPLSHSSDRKDSISSGDQIPNGVSFREEEIEDVGSLDPRVIDLMTHLNSNPVTKIPLKNKSVKALNLSSSEVTASGNSSQPIIKGSQKRSFEDTEFDFDQGLIDAYSDLIAQINPDDFLDFESDLTKEVDVQGRDAPFSEEDFLLDEELEEGEIVE